MTTILLFLFLVLFRHSLSVGTKRIPLHYFSLLFFYTSRLHTNKQHG
jgi:hypothetical protein